MLLTRKRRHEGLVASVPFWWHSIDVGDGVVTPGFRPAESLAEELAALDLPDVAGRTVLDIGAWDGYECRARGVSPEPYETVPGLWRPQQLAGKRGFDVARSLRKSGVEDRVAESMEADLDALGTFDLVLYLGILYHMTDPRGALRRLRRVTDSRAVIETEAISLPSRKICRFSSSMVPPS